VQRRIDRIDEVMVSSLLARDVVTYRGITSGRRMFGDRLDSDLTGMQWREDAYVSTSAERRQADLFTTDFGGVDAVLLHVITPAGTGAVQISGSNGGLAELLLDRGHAVEVVADRGVDDRGVRRLDVRVLPKAGADVAG
jgi:hypothetical protein